METKKDYEVRTNSLTYFTTVGNTVGGDLRITKVRKTANGFTVQVFNEYVTVGTLRIVVKHEYKFKIYWTIERNYSPRKTYTTYHAHGAEVSKARYTRGYDDLQTLFDTSAHEDFDVTKERIAEEMETDINDVLDDTVYAWQADDMQMWFDEFKDDIRKIYKEAGNMLFVGSVGTWRGTFPGGRYVAEERDLWSGNYDDVDVVLDHENKRVMFNFHDHDGSTSMELREMRSNCSDTTWDELEYDFFARAHNVTKTMYYKFNAYFNGK